MNIPSIFELRRACEQNTPVVLEVLKKRGDEELKVHPFCYITEATEKGLRFAQLPKGYAGFGRVNPGFIIYSEIMGVDFPAPDKYHAVSFKDYIKELRRNSDGNFTAEEWHRVRISLTLEMGSAKLKKASYHPVGYFTGLTQVKEITHKKIYSAILSVVRKDEISLEEIAKAQRKQNLTLDSTKGYMFDTIGIEKVVSKYDAG